MGPNRKRNLKTLLLLQLLTLTSCGIAYRYLQKVTLDVWNFGLTIKIKNQTKFRNIGPYLEKIKTPLPQLWNFV